MSQENDQKNYHYPYRLTMLHIGICKICGQKSKCKYLTIKYLLGWYYCEKCISIVRNSALTYITNELPVRILLNRPINFIRSSGESWVGTINALEPCLVFNQQEYMLEILFASTPEIKNVNMIYSRFISFKTILKLNPEIYDEIKTCTDFFCQDIKIGFNDLPLDMQNLILSI